MAGAISREALLKEYTKYRTSTNKSDDKELLQLGRLHLTNKAAEKRFPSLGWEHDDGPWYHWLRKLFNSDNPHPDAVLDIKSGCSHLEQYALNLWKFPWRKEFHVIKTHTGFFKCKVESSLRTDLSVWLITRMGYTQDPESKGHFLLNEPLDVDKIQLVSLDLFLVTIDLQIIHDIGVLAGSEGYSLKQAIKARYKTVRGKEEAIDWLRNQPKLGWTNKKPKLDKAGSESREEPEGVGHKPSGYNGVERTFDSQGRSEQKNVEEGSQNRPKGSDRETKFPPPFPSEYSPTDKTYSRDGATAYYSRSSAFAFDNAGPFMPESYLSSGGVGMEHLTDDLLYGHGDHSAEHQFPASQEMELSPNSSGLSEDQHNFPQLRPLSSKEKLYVNLPEKTPLFPTRTVALYQNVPVPLHTAIPESPPPTYADAVLVNGSNHEDFVVLEKPQPMEVDQVMPKNMYAGELTDRQHAGYNPQSYQGTASRECDVSSINRLKTLNLGARTTSRGTVDASTSGNGDLHNVRTTLYRPESGAFIPDTGRCEGHTSLENLPYSREPQRSATDQASRPSDKSSRHYQGGQYPQENAKQNKVQGGSQTSATERSNISNLVAGKYAPCEYCALDVSGFICENCFKLACLNCHEMRHSDRCPKAEKHNFVDVRNENKKKSSQRGLPGAPTESAEAWNCVRCTYVNPLESNVCVMCATTRGVSKPELPEPGSPVCRDCTFCNKEGSEVCGVCGTSLRLGTAETSV